MDYNSDEKSEGKQNKYGVYVFVSLDEHESRLSAENGRRDNVSWYPT